MLLKNSRSAPRSTAFTRRVFEEKEGSCSIPKFSPIMCDMKKSYPSRESDKWQHALTRPLARLPFATLELIRADLFEYLDLLTTNYYESMAPDLLARNDAEIQRAADRLKEMTRHHSRALRAGVKAGIVECLSFSDENTPELPSCGPFSTRGWEQFHRLSNHAR